MKRRTLLKHACESVSKINFSTYCGTDGRWEKNIHKSSCKCLSQICTLPYFTKTRTNSFLIKFCDYHMIISIMQCFDRLTSATLIAVTVYTAVASRFCTKHWKLLDTLIYLIHLFFSYLLLPLGATKVQCCHIPYNCIYNAHTQVIVSQNKRESDMKWDKNVHLHCTYKHVST